MSTASNKVLALFGPTACGKTELVSRLFIDDGRPLSVPAVLVSADAVQVYRGLDIGSAKPDAALRGRFPHELIDILDPSEPFSVGDFTRLADEACERAVARGVLPVLSGGTAYYIRAFIMGAPPAPPSDPVTRASVAADLACRGAAALWEELSRVDPASASRIAPADAYRICRALEVHRASGRPLSSFVPSREPRARWDVLCVGLERPREELYARIGRRVDAMVAAGLEDELRSLLAAGYGPGDPGMRAIGYAEFLSAAPGDSRESVIERIKMNTRRYAKRQCTFMRSLPGVRWLRMHDDDPAGDAAAAAALVGDWLSR